MPVDPRRALLSAALMSREAAFDLCQGLTDLDFTDTHRPVYRAIRSVLSRENKADASAVAEEISKSGIPDSYAFLVPFLSGSDESDHLMQDSGGRKAACAHIRSARIKHDLIAMVREGHHDLIPGYLKGIQANADAGGEISTENIQSFMALIESNATKKTLGYPTGLPTLDDIAGGMGKGQVWAVGAPTSAGKTTLLCQLVSEAAKAGAVCLFFSLEMSLPLMYSRLAAAFLQSVNPTDIYRGRIDDSTRLRVQGALELFRDMGLRVYREVNDAAEIMRRSKEAGFSRGRVDIVAVDFLQNVAVAGTDNMLHRMADASRMMQDLSGELDCTVLVASQLANDQVREKAGGIFSYRYASELAHAADIGIEMVPSSDGLGGVDIHIRKNRHGRAGKVPCKFNPHYSGFTETATPTNTATHRDLWGNN